MTAPGITTGPSRFILINSAKYGYGEIIVNQPVQLIGPNNIGKTTIINALQFLLIDDEKQMSFSRKLSVTKRFYFPDTFSYVLMEILTPAGIKVLGARGLGNIKNYNFERFSYNGEFERSDFINTENMVKSHEEISQNLVTKKFTTLEPRHLKAALTGVGDNKGVKLNIVPLRDANHYPIFQAVFKNLLHLSDLRQDELKEVILLVYKNDIQNDSIDLTGAYNEKYQAILRDKKDIEILSDAEPTIKKMVGYEEDRAGTINMIPALYEAILQEFKKIEKETDKQISCLRDSKKGLDGQITLLKERKKAKDEEEKLCHQQMGETASFFKRYNELKEKLKGFVPPLAQGELDGYCDQRDQLVVRLATASTDDILELTRKIKHFEVEIARYKRLLDTTGQLFITYLKKHLAPEEIKKIFTVFNEKILGLVVSDKEVTIDNEEELLKQFSLIAASVDEYNYFNASFGSLALDALPDVNITSFDDVDEITGKILSINRDLDELTKRLQSARDVFELKEEKKVVLGKIKSLEKKLTQAEDFHKLTEFLPVEERKKIDVEKLKLGIETERSEISAELEKLQRDISHLSEQERDLRSNLEKKQNNIQFLPLPDDEWPVKNIDLPTLIFEDMVDQYTKEIGCKESLDNKIREGVYSLTQRFSGAYMGSTDSETIGNLAGALDNLVEKKRKYDLDWKDLIVQLGSSFKSLYLSYQILRSKVEALNRKLAKVSVSNLNKLQLIVAGNQQWVPKIQEIALGEDSPLFVDHIGRKETLVKLAELFQSFPRLHLNDLFSLQFKLDNSDGTTTQYDHLDSIESNGTNITIKILINLILLRSLFSSKEIKIPFYLDEVANVSAANLQAILSVSNQLGFTPILAGTLPVDAAQVLYFMEEKKGRIWMKSRHLMILEKEDAA